jgi:hypothetical protein
LIGQCEYNEGIESYSLTGWYFGNMPAITRSVNEDYES